MKELKEKILCSIEKRLGLEHMEIRDENDYDVPIFSSDDTEGTGLNLDSIDAIEIIIAIKEDFGIKITDKDMKVLKSVSSIAEFVNKQVKE